MIKCPLLDLENKERTSDGIVGDKSHETPKGEMLEDEGNNACVFTYYRCK